MSKAIALALAMIAVPFGFIGAAIVGGLAVGAQAARKALAPPEPGQ